VVGLVSREAVQDAWVLVREWVCDAFAHSVHREHTPSEVYARLVDGRYSMLLIGRVDGPIDQRRRGVALVELNHGADGGRQLAMVAVGGVGIDEWLEHLFSVVVKMAADLGAVRVVAMGRPGWVRTMRRLGVVHRASVFGYELTAADILGDVRCEGSH
jgi:hypothetical protein